MTLGQGDALAVGWAALGEKEVVTEVAEECVGSIVAVGLGHADSTAVVVVDAQLLNMTEDVPVGEKEVLVVYDNRAETEEHADALLEVQ